MNEANRLENPMARFMFQDMEFPDAGQYKTNQEQLKRGYEDHRASQQGLRNTAIFGQGRNDSETVQSEGAFNVRAASDRKRAALAA